MTTIDEIKELRDRSFRKVYGVIVIDELRRLKYGCTICDGEFLSADSFGRHLAAQHIPETKPIIDYVEMMDDPNEDTSNNIQADSILHSNEVVAYEVIAVSSANISTIDNNNQIHPGNIGESSGVQNTPMVRIKAGTASVSHECTNEFKCDYCSKRYKTKSDKMRHMSIIHKSEFECVCSVCPTGFHDSSALAKHMETHTKKNNTYKCPFCSYILLSKYHKKNHLKQNHPNDSFECKICNSFVKDLPKHLERKHQLAK